ncbi:MAG: HPr(Ser) kinase/phosphatase [Metallibacterium scheffleri]|jgi:HPr kinase/phosphorylase|uniref:HPr(Ser) kinase/phosphatase n=1 Tax=Metallibacterium scheffleri TaxID=993689 RepID=UPI0026EA3B96|nr:HPr(Ser) kinase/phosphatase [Metallibacterium scheffleri]MCK9366209.1 HPr(Ser) kinase/phosphatase [Metallibacterium scheffleri]
MERITARQLFEKVNERLALRWIAGVRGESRLLEPSAGRERRPSLVGYLNLIYPNRVQIVGSEELAYLDGLEPRQRWEMLQKLFGHRPVAVIVTKDQAVPADLREAAEDSDTPLWISAQRGHEIYNWLQYHLTRVLARAQTLHGVLMEIYSIGVLVTGEPGTGKSELALDLITRGHRLVADDAPEFSLIAPDVIDGACPELLRDLLEVRGLGVLNVREMYGHTAVKDSKYLRLVLHLLPSGEHSGDRDGMQRLTGVLGQREILGVKMPQITIPVAPGRNLAVLAEAAVRNHMLKSKGIDPAQTFIDRQAHQMQRLPPW